VADAIAMVAGVATIPRSPVTVSGPGAMGTHGGLGTIGYPTAVVCRRLDRLAEQKGVACPGPSRP
jgi:hypothetical protein